MTDYTATLHDAAFQGKIDNLLSLLGQGINVNCTEPQHGWTALNWAAAYGKIDALKVLLSYGADVNISDHYGLSPLHWAALNGHNEIAVALLENRSNINAIANDGSTPLHSATMANQRTLVWNLLNKGADCFAFDHNGKTALNTAEEKGYKDICDMLRNAEKKNCAASVERTVSPLLYHIADLSTKLESIGHDQKQLRENVKQLSESNTSLKEQLSHYETEKGEFRRAMSNFNQIISDMKAIVEGSARNFKLDMSNLTQDLRRLESRFFEQEFPKLENSQVTWSDSGHHDAYEKLHTALSDTEDLQMNDLQQEKLKDTIVIIGIEEKCEEDLMTILQSLSHVLDIKMEADDIIKTSRTPDISWENFKPRIIEVQFKDAETAQNWISAFKNKKTTGISSVSIDPSFLPHQVFVNQKLTVFNRQLLNRTKEFALVNNFKFAWAQNGVILLRKDNKGPTIRIRSLKDFPVEQNFHSYYATSMT